MLRLLLIAVLLVTPGLRADAAPAILVLGDSLSASYGLARERGWVSLLKERLAAEGLPHRVINASVSGDTTAGGLTRLPDLLRRESPEVVVIQLGANDGLRGQDLALIRDRLNELVERAQAAGSRVLLVGNRLPPNYGAAYTEGFQDVFEAVAEARQVPLVPFLLEGVAERWELIQPDGLHPKAAAQPQLLDNVWSELGPLLGVSA